MEQPDAGLGPLGPLGDAEDEPSSSGWLSHHAAGITPSSTPPPPPDPQIDSQTLDQLLLRVSSARTDNRPFSMADIIADPALQQAARQELAHSTAPQVPIMVETANGGGSQAAGEVAGGVSRLMLGNHEGEVERQRMAIAAIDQDVQEESRVNREISDLIVERLERSKASLDALVKLLAVQASAASAYAAALHPAAKHAKAVDSGSGDGEVLQGALAALGRLPQAVGQAHRQLHASLTLLTAEVQRLHERYKVAVREVSAEATALAKHIDGARKAMAGAFTAHADACTAFDGVLGERAEGRVARGPDVDPWATEGRLVQEHKGLQRWQDKERSFLKTAFTRARELEAARLDTLRATLGTAADAHRAAYGAIVGEVEAVGALVGSEGARGVPARPLEELSRAAATATEVAEALAARQAESIAGVCAELFCSPEIVRQGELQAWDGSSSVWQAGHAVLTRAGFLHWFRSTDDPTPSDTLALAKCAFEAGQAPCFNIVEERGLGRWALASLARHARKATFQASGVDECCEWAIAIREAIAVAGGKQAAYAQ